MALTPKFVFHSRILNVKLFFGNFFKGWEQLGAYSGIMEKKVYGWW